MKNTAPKIWKFNNRNNALNFANRAEKAHAIILGDDGKFWVTTLAAAEQLHRNGYTWA